MVRGLLARDDSAEAIIVWQLRMPRTALAILVGAALGAGIATLAVFLVSRRRTSTGDRTLLVLAGAAISASLGSITDIITLYDSSTFSSYRFWVIGSVADRGLDPVVAIAQVIGAGLLLAAILAPALNVPALGEEQAMALGVPLGLVRAGTLLAITALCAAAGPIAFVGLAVPHALRLLVGIDQRALTLLAVVGGPALVLAADIIGLVAVPDGDLEAGLVTTLIGAPVLLALVPLTTLAAVLVTLVTGSFEITAGAALRTLVGGGAEIDRFIVLDQRRPGVIAALLIGVALAVSGALFQNISRNALASPDIIGFTTGAATGGLVMLLLVGIAIAALLSSVIDYLLSRADLEEAEVARTWQLGSLHAIGWGPVLMLLVLLVLALPLALGLRGELRALDLGEEVAAGVGVDLPRTRIRAMAVGVVLAAVWVATAGPIGFVALAAPQIARRLAQAPGTGILPAAAMGAQVMVVSELLGQRLLSPFQIPVGLITSAVGGVYLAWVVLRRH